MKIFICLLCFVVFTSPDRLEQEVKTGNEHFEWLKAEANRILNKNKPEDVQNFSLCIENDGRFELSIIREDFQETYSSFLDALDYSSLSLDKNSLQLNCHSTYCIEYSRIFPKDPGKNEREYEDRMTIPLQQKGLEMKQLEIILEKAIKEAGGKRLEDLVFDDRC